MAFGMVSLAATTIALTASWAPFLVAWVFPLTFLCHISALLRFTCEHRWLHVPDRNESPKLVLARLTVGRFLGDPVPCVSLPWHQRVLAWGNWTIRLIFIHLPARVFVLVGDLPSHDWHHRHPTKDYLGNPADWANAAYERFRDMQDGCQGWPEPYCEVWGLFPAIDAVFELLSRLPPIESLDNSVSIESIEDLIHGM